MLKSKRQKQILKTMGIPVWTAHRDIAGQKIVEAQVSELETPAAFSDDTGLVNDSVGGLVNDPANGSVNDSVDSWQLLQQEITDCTACELHQSRTKPVFGVGNEQASLMIIGEAPGHEEDLQGEPFVGPAGQLLNQMLFALGLSRDDVFIANILKCSPPDNRKPLATEVEACSGFLARQINLLKPDVILSVGAVSAQNLLASKDRIGILRGQVNVHAQTSTPLVATYHPAYLLRKPTEKRAVWSDLLLVKKLMSEKV